LRVHGEIGNLIVVMKMNKVTFKIKGIGLIEVLVATVVIATGLLAVASMQTGFLSISGENKARAEAIVLAEQKIEELRSNINKTSYEANLVDGNDEVTGVNSVFTRVWVITGKTAFFTTAPERKEISVKVVWGAESSDETINMVTEVAWVNPADSALHASQSGSTGTGAVPSPRQNASEDVASEKVIGTDLEIVGDGTTTGLAGTDASLSAVVPDVGTIPVYQVAPDSHFYTAVTANLSSIESCVIAVFLCDTGTCTHIQNHFGGVVHSIMGKVYSTSPLGLSDISVAWTSSDVNDCYNAPTVVGEPRVYECVFAGNCDGSSSGSRLVNNSTPGCFHDEIVSDAQIISRNVGPGGEYGDVGLLGVSDAANTQEQVCFLEDTSSVLGTASGNDVLNEEYMLAVTKRFYVTRAIKDAKLSSQGINQSFVNHDFLVIERKTGCLARAVEVSVELAPREISRILPSGSNGVLSASTFVAGTVEAATTIEGSVGVPASKLFIERVGACYVDRVTGDNYVCAVPAGTSATKIYGVNSGFKACEFTGVNCDWAGSFTITP